MRMWMLPPHTLCRQHLLGEHYEIHMLAGYVRNGRKLKGFEPFVETHNLFTRHSAIAVEMRYRGYNHKSPLDLPDKVANFGYVDKSKSKEDLHGRCEECKKRWKQKLESA